MTKVVVLDHADLRGHLEGDRAGQLQVVQLLLKAADAGSCIVVRGLGVLGLDRTPARLLQRSSASSVSRSSLHAELARDDVHGELLVDTADSCSIHAGRASAMSFASDDAGGSAAASVILSTLTSALSILGLQSRRWRGTLLLEESRGEPFFSLGFVVVQTLQLHDEARRASSPTSPRSLVRTLPSAAPEKSAMFFCAADACS